MKIPIQKWLRILSIISAVIFAGFACNLPTPTTVSPGTTEIPPLQSTSALEVPPVTEIIEPPPPTSEPTFIQTDLPTVILNGGTGYIFSSQQILTDDRDIWWNSSEIIPVGQGATPFARMVSLGQIGSPAELFQISTDGMGGGAFKPILGEGFAIEIDRDGVIQYAIFRVVSLEGRILTFDWVFPYLGDVVGSQ